MRDLEISVKLKLENGEIQNRILISPGTKEVFDSSYHAKSYVPIQQWSIPSEKDLSALLDHNDKSLEYNKSIKIITIPEEIKQLCEKIGFDAILDRRDIRKNFAIKQGLFSDFEQVLSQYLLSFKQMGDIQPVVHAFPIVTQGLQTITKRYINGIEDYLFCGLHIDCDSGGTLETCALAKNRISINLTSQPRELLYVNVAVDEIHTKFSKEFGMNLNLQSDRNELTRDFFQKNLNYPIVKVKIMPYEAYIAPTDNLIHDATTIGRTIEDVTLVAIGKFMIT